MDDRIQSLLERWHAHGDKAAFSLAFTLCKAEWWPMVIGRLRDRSRAEEVLSDLLAILLIAAGSTGSPTAPAGHPNPKAFRRKTVDWAIRTRARAEFTRQDYEKGFARNQSPEAIAAERQRNADARRQRRSRPPPIDVRPEGEPVSPDAETLFLAKELRARVAAALPRLSIRRRMAVAMTGGFDPSAWVGELADDLEEAFETVGQRVQAAMDDPDDRDLKVRVLFPEEPSSRTRNGWDQHVSRGCAQLRELLGVGEPS